MSTQKCCECVGGDGKCRTCEGRGWIPRGVTDFLVDIGDDALGGVDRDDCSTCNGSGECQNCHGSGEIEVDDDD